MLFRLLETYGWLGTILWDWFTRFWGWATHDASGYFMMLLTGIAVFQLGFVVAPERPDTVTSFRELR
jgi:hypothetical protein